MLSTNVAEASVTLVNLDAVIDFAHENARFRNVMSKVLESRASSTQRRGRAGRTGEGSYLLMLSKAQYTDLPEYREPAVCKLSLASVVLSSLSTGQVDFIAAYEAGAVIWLRLSDLHFGMLYCS